MSKHLHQSPEFLRILIEIVGRETCPKIMNGEFWRHIHPMFASSLDEYGKTIAKSSVRKPRSLPRQKQSRFTCVLGKLRSDNSLVFHKRDFRSIRKRHHARLRARRVMAFSEACLYHLLVVENVPVVPKGVEVEDFN